MTSQFYGQFLPQRAQSNTSIPQGVGGMMQMKDMFTQRKKKRMMEEVAQQSVDPQTGQLDPQLYIQNISRIDPQMGYKMQQQMMKNKNAQDKELATIQEKISKSTLDDVKSQSERIQQLSGDLDMYGTPSKWNTFLKKATKKGMPNIATQYPEYSEEGFQNIRKGLLSETGKMKYMETEKAKIERQNFLNWKKDPTIVSLHDAASLGDKESKAEFNRLFTEQSFATLPEAKQFAKSAEQRPDMFLQLMQGADYREGLQTGRRSAIEKEEQERMGTSVPGFEAIKGVRLTPTSVTKAKTIRESGLTLREMLGDLQTMYDESGTQVIPGAIRGEMESTVKDIQLELKELVNLGVLNGPDLVILQQQIPDPTTFTDASGKFVGEALGKGDPINAKFKTFKKNLERKLRIKMGGHGFQEIKKKKNDLTPEEQTKLDELRKKYGKVPQ